MKMIQIKTQKPPRGIFPVKALKLALLEKPLSLEFPPFEIYIYGKIILKLYYQ